MTHEEILKGLYDNTLIGNAPEVKDLTNQGVEDGLDPESMLYDALIPSLEEVGARFERGEGAVRAGHQAEPTIRRGPPSASSRSGPWRGGPPSRHRPRSR